DALLVVLGFVLAYVMRDVLDRPDGIRTMIDLIPDRSVPFLMAPLSAYWWVILLAALYWPILQDQQLFYRQPVLVGWKKAFWMILRTGVIILAGLLSVFFLSRAQFVNRTYVVGAILLTTVLIFTRHVMHTAWIRHRTREGLIQGFPVLLAAPWDKMGALVKWLKNHPEEYYTPAGLIIIGPMPGDAPSIVEGVRVCGGIGELVRIMHEVSASGVIIGSSGLNLDLLKQIVTVCETEGVDAWLLADFVQTRTARVVTGSIGGQEALVFTTSTTAVWQSAVKRILDVTGSLLGILFFGPLMLVLALLIKLLTPGPALFMQRRSGLHGNPFSMIKFRSMYSDAEMRKSELERFNEMEGPVFKISNDPRITPLGRILRRWSLDELPQLFNVLAGHMSLVGPRPLPVYEVNTFGDMAYRRRLSMKPGLTCLWQIRGRNKVRDFDEWVRLDLEYIDHWSLWLDVKILLATPFTVLKGTGC
ncbi:MAG: sugar transferase, partial [Lentisphaerota bacterium]